ncbi:MAG: cytidylate kinase family protein [Deltaproteobacteria bacterium]|nr:cytidylate kinase family protein [Deltaproteobacteria bacterium]MBW2305805.1 cytidylate kinase family protein [Deltaproteobacteria bacterium]
MSIIALSRELGAGAEEIIESVCRELGYISVDKQEIGEMVTGYGFQFDSLEKYDEKKPPFWEFVSGERSKVLHTVKIAIYDLARKGNVIIIGRGGFLLLKDIPGVLRVKIVAPFETRVRNMAKTGKSPKEIEDILRNSDREREGFIRHYYHADENDTHRFDLVINTEKISFDKAARLIIESRRLMDEPGSEAEAREKLADLAIKLKVELAVTQDKKVDITSLDVEVNQGNVEITGFVRNEQYKKACEEAALRVEGVKSVDNRITIASALPYGQ